MTKPSTAVTSIIFINPKASITSSIATPIKLHDHRRHDLGSIMAKQPSYPSLEFIELPGVGTCPVCSVDAVRWVTVYPSDHPTFRSAVLFFCAHCGSAHVPKADMLIEGYYENAYGLEVRYQRSQYEIEQYFTAPEKTTHQHFVRARRHRRSLLLAGARFERVLDFGAGKGAFLSLIHAQSKFAVEPDPTCRPYLSYVGAEIIDSDEIGEECFDVVIASHSIEHLSGHKLNSTLVKLVSALTTEGFGLIEVPNGGLSYLQKPNQQDPHTLFFTHAGLTEALATAGASVDLAYTRIDAKLPKIGRPIFNPAPIHSGFRHDGEGMTFIFSKKKNL